MNTYCKMARMAWLLLVVFLTGCGGGSGGGKTDAPDPSTFRHFSYTALDSSKLTNVVVSGFNNAGQLAGYFSDGSGSRAFRHQGTSSLTQADSLPIPEGKSARYLGFQVNALNSSGTVSGTFSLVEQNGSGTQYGIVYDPAPRLLEPPSADFLHISTLFINDQNILTGILATAQGNVLFRHFGSGALTTQDVLGSFPDFPGFAVTAVNARGTIVGWGERNLGPPPSPSIEHAYVYDTRFHDLGVVAGRTSVAEDINDAGQICGGFQVGSGAVPPTHAFRHSGVGPLITADDLGTLPGLTSSAGQAINAAGTVVGACFNPVSMEQGGPVPEYAFVCFAGKAMQSLNEKSLVTNLPDGVVLEKALFINDHGQILGQSTLPSSQARFWLLTPVP